MQANVELPALLLEKKDKKAIRRRSQSLLERLGIGSQSQKHPWELSGGQQQRVLLARALVGKPELLIMDEPTTALDPETRENFYTLLQQLNGDIGTTVILVTHDQQVAHHAERIIEISDGMIIRDQANPNRQATTTAILPAKVSAEQSINFLQANWGHFAEAFKMALIAMMSHRMRTLLTMLGIIIGITSVVSVVALGQGAQQKVIKDISAMGTNVIDVNPGKDWGDEDAASIQTLVQSDLEALKAQVYVDSASPATGGSQLLRYRNVIATASVNGVSEQYFRVKGYDIAEGIAFTADDVKQQAQVVVIDQNTRKKFFATEDPIGKVLFIIYFPDPYRLVLGEATKRQRPLDQMETELLGINHAQMAGLIMQRWNFPETLVMPSLYHHRPSTCPQPYHLLAMVVEMADFVCHQAQIGHSGNPAWVNASQIMATLSRRIC